MAWQDHLPAGAEFPYTLRSAIDYGRESGRMVVCCVPSTDSWVRRRFFDDIASPEITFVAYDESGKLDEARWEAIKSYSQDMVKVQRQKIEQLWDRVDQVEPMRKMPDTDRKAATFDHPREVTNRKARRAEAAKRRPR